MNQQALKQIIQSLQQDQQLLQQLSPLLQKQYVLLSLRKSAELDLLNQQATDLLAQVQRNHQLRKLAMADLQLPLTEQGFAQLLQKLPAGIRNASEDLLQKVQRHTELCQQLNQKNGELLAQQRGLLQRLLGQPDQQSYPQLSF
ncbi:flagellar export chaperone FlgN [Rheinheimera marina]|uniref:Flagellar export chaperone FlgN n=1 Tax=Rheinheimera marina TaxID=1774958 RepID=A0ABV9JJF9_9GAMM